ncbi:MAG TPA: radical SAM protein [Patescibacteria group bacterium]|nr:radical SAM protein [Patescibacteria group bacterium]
MRSLRDPRSNALDDPKVIASLPRYVDVVKGNRLAKFVIARGFQVDFDDASTSDLWSLHARSLEGYLKYDEALNAGEIELDTPDSSFLDLKVELGKRIMESCHLCARRCGVDRSSDETGYCRCSDDFAYSSCFTHLGEEPELVPSGTIFTCGCTIRCIHCQNWQISQWREAGDAMTPEGMAKIVEVLRRHGCWNINMVGGDPTPNAWLWLRTMHGVTKSIATVWNSNSYYSTETAQLLAGFIDLYLLDFKYGNNRCAEEISDAPGYWEECTRNHLMAKRYGELLIRVLVLPSHNECCTGPIINWIAENLGPMTRVNLMFQYRPEWRAGEREELRRRLTRAEIQEALDMARDAGLVNLVRG